MARYHDPLELIDGSKAAKAFDAFTFEEKAAELERLYRLALDGEPYAEDDLIARACQWRVPAVIGYQLRKFPYKKPCETEAASRAREEIVYRVRHWIKYKLRVDLRDLRLSLDTVIRQSIREVEDRVYYPFEICRRAVNKRRTDGTLDELPKGSALNDWGAVRVSHKDLPRQVLGSRGHEYIYLSSPDPRPVGEMLFALLNEHSHSESDRLAIGLRLQGLTDEEIAARLPAAGCPATIFHRVANVRDAFEWNNGEFTRDGTQRRAVRSRKPAAPEYLRECPEEYINKRALEEPSATTPIGVTYHTTLAALFIGDDGHDRLDCGKIRINGAESRLAGVSASVGGNAQIAGEIAACCRDGFDRRIAELLARGFTRDEIVSRTAAGQHDAFRRSCATYLRGYRGADCAPALAIDGSEVRARIERIERAFAELRRPERPAEKPPALDQARRSREDIPKHGAEMQREARRAKSDKRPAWIRRLGVPEVAATALADSLDRVGREKCRRVASA